MVKTIISNSNKSIITMIGEGRQQLIRNLVEVFYTMEIYTRKERSLKILVYIEKILNIRITLEVNAEIGERWGGHDN